MMILIGIILIFLFQFHKGTIRTQGIRAKQGAESQFQFHEGTIRTYERHLYFPSIAISIP